MFHRRIDPAQIISTEQVKYYPMNYYVAKTAEQARACKEDNPFWPHRKRNGIRPVYRVIRKA